MFVCFGFSVDLPFATHSQSPNKLLLLLPSPEKKMGGFLIGSTCSSPSPPLHSSRFLPSPSSSSQFLLLCSNNAAKSKRRRPPSVSLRSQDANNDAVSLKRRAIVLVGISVLPFFQLQSPALADESEFLSSCYSSDKNVIFHCFN